MSVLIWITIWHSDGIPERSFIEVNFEKSLLADDNKRMKNILHVISKFSANLILLLNHIYNSPRFFQNHLFEKFIQEYHQSVKQSGPTFWIQTVYKGYNYQQTTLVAKSYLKKMHSVGLWSYDLYLVYMIFPYLLICCLGNTIIVSLYFQFLWSQTKQILIVL